MTRLMRALALAALVAALAATGAEATKNAPTPTPTPASGWTTISLADGALDVVVVSLWWLY